MDPRLKQLSYSSLLTLHACPRQYQLYKLNSEYEDDEGQIVTEQTTFAFGHAVGTGIQSALEGKSEDRVILDMFIAWDAALFDADDRRNKSFWLAIAAVQRFILARKYGLLKGYELVIHEGKPAVELSFLIKFPDGFVYRGFVDAVLQHKDTGEILVLEVKTTSMTNVNAAQYKNSAQAIGYSIVLDSLFPALSSYKVHYLVYKTKAMEYESLPFTKDYLQRALWIRELLLDIETIKMYEGASIYPMRGESCLRFYRECKYLSLCTMATERLVKPLTQETVEGIAKENAQYQIQLTLDDLIHSQLSKE